MLRDNFDSDPSEAASDPCVPVAEMLFEHYHPGRPFYYEADRERFRDAARAAMDTVPA